MHPRTQATFAELERADWFAAVGVVDTAAAVVLSSWPEAVAHCGSSAWQDLMLEARNQYCERLVERSQERFSQWNEIVVPLKALTMPLVARKTTDVCARHQLPKIFVGRAVGHPARLHGGRVRRRLSAGILCQPGLLVRQGTFSLRLAG